MSVPSIPGFRSSIYYAFIDPLGQPTPTWCSFHIKDRKAPVPRVVRNLGSPSPSFDHLPTGSSNRVGTVHSLEGLPENRHTPFR